jgi:hypothetical protein
MMLYQVIGIRDLNLLQVLQLLHCPLLILAIKRLRLCALSGSSNGGSSLITLLCLLRLVTVNLHVLRGDYPW